MYTRATHDHAATETSPGHATLATGVYPARHGIPANVWRESAGGELRLVENVLDTSERVLGNESYLGSSSRIIRRQGIGDWVAAADDRSRVVSLSAKDRGSILLAGQSKGEVYWFDAVGGRFVTSTFYRDEYPAWIEAFNTRFRQNLSADTVWASTVPREAAPLSGADTAAYERDGVHTLPSSPIATWSASHPTMGPPSRRRGSRRWAWRAAGSRWRIGSWSRPG